MLKVILLYVNEGAIHVLVLPTYVFSLKLNFFIYWRPKEVK